MLTRLFKNLGRFSAKTYSLKDNKRVLKRAMIAIYSFVAIDLLLDTFVTIPLAVTLYVAGQVTLAIYLIAGVLLFNLAIMSLIYNTSISAS